MASTTEFKLYIEDQLSEIPHIRLKKMFGEYGLFLEDKMVALLCDDNLYIKPTEEGIKLLKEIEYAPPYKGAKPYFLIENTDDRQLLRQLIEITFEALPIPKEKKKKHL
jgi:TfoX/Sxy family transcriptional regulator of competence genes